MNLEKDKDPVQIDGTFKTKLNKLENSLDKIKHDFKALNLSDLKNSPLVPTLFERIMNAEKDISILQVNINQICDDVDLLDEGLGKLQVSYQELVGTINQIRLEMKNISIIADQHIEEKKQLRSVLFQIAIPIILSIIFFVFGQFFRSCSFISNDSEDSYKEYKEFENKPEVLENVELNIDNL